MIEVEKKFQPTDEQLARMLEGAEFVSDKEHTDIYYDVPDLRFFKNEIRLRKRNENFELKMEFQKKSESGVELNSEFEDEKDILKQMGFDENENLSEIVKTQMIPLFQIKTKRKKYKKDGFVIDIDKTDFGYDMCEIELLVEDGSKTKEAEEKIINFAVSYGFELKKLRGKLFEYTRLNKLDLHNEVWGKK